MLLVESVNNYLEKSFSDPLEEEMIKWISEVVVNSAHNDEFRVEAFISIYLTTTKTKHLADEIQRKFFENFAKITKIGDSKKATVIFLIIMSEISSEYRITEIDILIDCLQDDSAISTDGK